MLGISQNLKQHINTNRYYFYNSRNQKASHFESQIDFKKFLKEDLIIRTGPLENVPVHSSSMQLHISAKS